MKPYGKYPFALRFILYFVLIPTVAIWALDSIPGSNNRISGKWIGIFLYIAVIYISIDRIQKTFPSVLSRFGLGTDRRRFIGGFLPILIFTSYAIWDTKMPSGGFPILAEGLFLAFLIGFGEEIFCRGLMFSALERYGVWTAAIVNSIVFGILHLGNFLWGHQSGSFSISQMSSAMAIGFMFTGMMLYTGSIYYPIIFHALIDLPVILKSPAEVNSLLASHPPTNYLLADLAIFFAIGMIYITRTQYREKLEAAKLTAASSPTEVL